MHPTYITAKFNSITLSIGAKAAYQKLSHWKDLIAQTRQELSCCKIDSEIRAAERYTFAIDLDDILEHSLKLAFFNERISSR
jgi:hypothetical protein